MGQIVLIQLLRAVAAILVALGHFQDESIAIAARHGVVLHPWLSELTGFGVDLFFVISGFVMVYASRKDFAEPGAGPVFLIRRLVRIMPLYVLVTALMLATILIAPHTVTSGVPAPGEIVKSLFFIPYAVNGGFELSPVFRAGWTLNFEMMFYALFAVLIVLPMQRAVIAMTLVLAGLVLAGRLVSPSAGILAYWSSGIVLEFAAGAWIAVAYLSGVRLRAPVVLALLIAALGAVLATADAVPSIRGLDRALFWGLPAGLIIASVILSGWAQGETPRWLAPAVLLGNASYALYLTHIIVIRVEHLIWDTAHLSEYLPDEAFVWIGMILMLPVAILTYTVIEKPLTATLRRWLEPTLTTSTRI